MGTNNNILNKNLISVVIPVFNAEKYIVWQLDIIKRQGVDDIEVLFVDNNSHDNSVQTIQSYIHSKLYAFPIQLLSEKKQGAGAARNRGLKAAKGKYITFLDVDDEILEGKWKKDLSILRKNDKLDYVFCRTKRVYEDGKTVLHDNEDIKSRVINVKYEEFLTSPENVLPSVLERLGLSLEPHMLKNTGVKSSRSDYILFLDSDDFIDLSLVVTSLMKISEEQPDVVAFDLIKFWENGKKELWRRRNHTIDELRWNN